MTKRDANLQWLKDMLDHLATCRNQLEWARGQEADFLTTTMLHDLECCQRVCESLRRRPALQRVG